VSDYSKLWEEIRVLRDGLKDLGLVDTSTLTAARASYEDLKRDRTKIVACGRIESRLGTWAALEKRAYDQHMDDKVQDADEAASTGRAQKKRFAIRDCYIASWVAEREQMERIGRDFDSGRVTAGAIAGFYLQTFGPFALWFFDSTAPPSHIRQIVRSCIQSCIQEAMALPSEKEGQ
jgi:hypothetical protein